jgi:hypothetical protein
MRDAKKGEVFGRTDRSDECGCAGLEERSLWGQCFFRCRGVFDGNVRVGLFHPDDALAAVATAEATLAEMIVASIFRAVDANGA